MQIKIDADDLLRWARFCDDVPRHTKAALARALNTFGIGVVNETIRIIAEKNGWDPDVVRSRLIVQEADAHDLEFSMDASAVVAPAQDWQRPWAGRDSTAFEQDTLVKIVTMDDGYDCDVCREIAEEGPYTLSEVMDMQARWAEYVPPTPNIAPGPISNLIHPRAYLEGSTVASYGLMHELVAAKYHGPAVRLATNVGVVTIGPNHPMLTRRGFVRAYELAEGDDLIYDLRTEGAIGEIRSESSGVFFSTRTRASNAGFGPIESIIADSTCEPFGFGGDIGTLDRSTMMKSAVIQPYFKKVPLVEDIFPAFGSKFVDPHFVTTGHDFHGDVVFCEPEVQTIRPARHLLPIFDSCGLEQFGKLDFSRTNMHLFRILGLSAQDGLFGFASDFVESSDYSPRTDAITSCKSWDALTRLVESVDFFRWQRVLSNHVVEFSGLAFDATTATGVYNVSGMVVKNCRCQSAPWSSYRRLPVTFQGSGGSVGSAPSHLLTMKQLGKIVRDEISVELSVRKDSY